MINRLGISVLFFCFIFFQYGTSQENEPPTLSALGDQYHCSLSPLPIVTDFNIVDPDDTEIESLNIQISTGYRNGADRLSLIGSHPNIIASWNASQGKLRLTGTGGTEMLYTDLIVAVKDVVYESFTLNNSGEKFFSFTIGDANYLPSTGHYYEYVANTGISWNDARANAANRRYFGLQGYLATIMSPEEAQLTGEQAGGVGWLGGSDAETEGVWKWVTGPEAGTIFWNGGANGTTPNYANWNNSEPNNLGDEDYIHVTFGIGRPGSWNDLPNIGGVNDYFPQGYIVEYGGMPDELPIDISASTKITMLSLLESSDIPPLITCDTNVDGNDTNGFTVFDLTSHESILLNGNAPSAFQIDYFTDDTYQNPIPNPSAYENIEQNNQIIYVRIANNLNTNCYTDTSFSIQVDALPVVQPSIIFKNCDEDGTSDGFTNFNLNEVDDIITNGNSENLEITYYLSPAEANSGDDDNAINPVPFNNETASTVYARVENANGCFRISTINLEVSTTALDADDRQVLETCDDDAIIDGLHEFDLTTASQGFRDAFPGVQNLTVHYYRNLSDAQLELNEITNQTNYFSEVPFSQILFVRVESEDNGDCFSIGPHLTLTVHPRPEFEVEQLGIYCFDNEPITLSTFNPQGTYTYEWTDADGIVVGNQETLTLNVPGTYTVIATLTDFGCKSFPVVFPVVESAIASITSDDVTVVEFSNNNSITIATDNLGIGDYEFALDAISGPYQDEPIFNNVGAGAHTIYVQDKNGCGIASLDVFVLGFPRYFTPNDDGQNDTWNIKGLSEAFSQEFKISIFDRYGKLIKQINPRGDGWNGTFNGEKLIASDYWFMVDLLDANGNKKTYRGHFSLVR